MLAKPIYNIKCLILLLLLSVVNNAFGQSWCSMKLYTLTDGYVHGNLNEVMMDSRGLIWICSRDGLTRFDGYSFKNIKSYPGDGILMGSSNISSIHENSQGDIWCRNQDGRAYLFDVKEGKFHDVFRFIDQNLLLDNSVVRIFTLQNGATWILTKNGTTFRFDDRRCKMGEGITREDVIGATIRRPFEDYDGDEWIFTDKGIYIIGGKKLEVNIPFVHFIKINGEIWLSDGKEKMARYNSEGNCLDYYQLPKNVNSITYTKVLNKQTIALGSTNSGLLLFDIVDQTCQQIDVDVLPGSPNEVFTIFQQSNGDLWMSSRFPGIIRYQKNNGKVSILQPPILAPTNQAQPNKFMVMEDNAGSIWIVPKDGNFCYFDQATEKLIPYYTDPANPLSIVSPNVRYFYMDQQKNIWIDNYETLCKLSFFEKDFNFISPEKDEIETRSFLLDSNKNLWVGLRNGKLMLYDRNNKCIGYITDKGILSAEPANFNGNIYAMMEDREGNIWIGTRLRGIYLFKPKLGHQYQYDVQHFVNEPNNNYSLSDNSVYSFFQDKAGRIWIGTYSGGLNMVERDERENIRFVNSKNRLKAYPADQHKGIRFITESASHVLMFGTTNGLLTCSSDFESTDEIRFFVNQRRADDPFSLVNNDIFFIFVDSYQNTFILPRNGGINQIVKGENLLSDKIRFKSFTEKDGLLSDQVLSMVEAPKSSLWLVSKQTLSKYEPVQARVEHFCGLMQRQMIQFSEAAPLVNSMGNLILGTNQGFFEFIPNRQNTLKIVPSIVFTGVTIQGEKTNPPVSENSPIVLNPSQRNLNIQFAALDYRDTKDIQYAYMLEGIEDDWNNAGRERSATYNNLPHGTFRFLVRSTNSEGFWVDNTTSTTIVVKPKFLETFWAWILLVAAIVAFIQLVVYILFRFYRLRQEVLIKQKMTDLKLNFFTEVSHELRTPLTLISSPIDDLIDNEPLSEKAIRHLTVVKKNTDRMLRMVNQILDLRKLQHKKMKLLVEETEMTAFLTQIMDGFSHVAKEKGIEFRLDTGKDQVMLWIDKEKMEKIIFNLISNAFKYTSPNKTITVKIDKEDNFGFISVIDQGIGIPSNKIDQLFQQFETMDDFGLSETSTGIGLSLVKELVALHLGKIDVISLLGKGSEFKVSLPLGNKHLAGKNHVELLLTDSNNHEQLDVANIENGAVSKTEKSINDRITILIVEDNKELLSFLHDVLAEDYEVIEAVNGQDGLEKARLHIPDIILSDVMMPVKDGLELVDEVKRELDLCHIPIILLSAKSSLDDRINGLEHGVDDYIPKPFSTNLLKARIKNLIKQRESLQAYYRTNYSLPNGLMSNGSLMPLKPVVTSYDEQFIRKLMEFMEENMDNVALSVDDFAHAFSMSRPVFFKKMKSLLGTSPVDFMRDIRIKRAIQHLETGNGTLAEIAYRCGFNDPNYFSKCFKKQIGVSPSEYKKAKK